MRHGDARTRRRVCAQLLARVMAAHEAAVAAARDARAELATGKREIEFLRSVATADADRTAALRSALSAVRSALVLCVCVLQLRDSTQVEVDAAASRAEVEALKQRLYISESDCAALHKQLGDARLELEETRLQGVEATGPSPRSPRERGGARRR